MLKATILRLRALFRQSATDRELDDEIRLHLELETEKNIGVEMTPSAARRKATLDFGGVERTKEAHRDGFAHEPSSLRMSAALAGAIGGLTVTASDTVTFVAVSVFFVALALAAGFIPACRTTKSI